MANKLFKKAHSVTADLTSPFGSAKDRDVTPGLAPTSTSKDRVGSITDAPSKVLPSSASNAPHNVVQGTPVQKDGTVLVKQPPNVEPGPDSMPWWRRAIRTVVNGDEGRVLFFQIPEGKAYRMERVGHLFYSALDEFWVIYDGKLLNDVRWAFPLGTPAAPYELRVSVTATDYIACFARNRSGDDHLYEYFIDGYYDQLTFQQGSRTS